MSGLAKYLIQNGCKVSGSDICGGKYIDKLKNLGANICIGHSADNVPDNAVVVLSSAVKETNPELLKAKEKNLTIYHRSDLLNRISRTDKIFIGFSGTHGKTTTSGLTSYVLSKLNLNPSFVVGGIIPEYETNAEYSPSGKEFIAELDESDGTIVKYSPDILVINNLEADHTDFYKGGLKPLIETFEEFLSNLKSTSKVLINNDNEGVLRLKNKSGYITFGLNKADYTAQNISYNRGFTTFDVYYKDEFLTSLKIIIPGVHNVYNALAVAAALHQNNTDLKSASKHFETFTGMGRRFQKSAQIGGITVYDDYAHHPTEIKSTLDAMKSFTDKKVVAVFQPHRYTRFQSLWEDFKKSLSSADRVIVTDVYSASEDEIAGVNSAAFAEELNNCEHISGGIPDVAKKLLPKLDNDCVVIGLGAGTITNLGEELKKAADGYGN